jgi:hypothetical protein
MLWPAEFLDPGSGRIGRRSLWLHKAPPLMKDLAQQLRCPEAWKPTHLSPLVSFDPVRLRASRPRENAERWRGVGDCRFQPSRVSCCDITCWSLLASRRSSGTRMATQWWPCTYRKSYFSGTPYLSRRSPLMGSTNVAQLSESRDPTHAIYPEQPRQSATFSGVFSLFDYSHLECGDRWNSKPPQRCASFPLVPLRCCFIIPTQEPMVFRVEVHNVLPRKFELPGRQH